MTCQHTMSLGVYLLGALEPAERHDFEAHLATCDTCRRELVRLSPLPGMLNQISPEDFEDERPPTYVEPPPPIPIPDTPRRPTRRYARLVGAAAVAVLVAIGGVFGWQSLRHTDADQPPPGVTWSATGADGVSGDARLVDHEWGTEIQVTMRALPPGKKCYLVVYDRYGRYEVAGWWGTDHAPEQEIPASTSIDRSKIDRLEFKLDEATTVLTLEPPAR